jgi:hypothetical protein
MLVDTTVIEQGLRRTIRSRFVPISSSYNLSPFIVNITIPSP